MRLIDADALLKQIEDKAKRIGERNPSASDTVNGLMGAWNMVYEAPTIDVNMDMKEKKPSVASWIKTEGEINAVGDWGKVYKCSYCDRTEPYISNYCPYCGAEMYYGVQ